MVNTIDSVAVIGTGEMGAPMAAHLIEGGFEVHAFDVSEEARDQAADHGAMLAESPGDAASRADLTLVVVGTADQVESVLSDDDGVFENADDGHLVAISSTLAPEACMAYADLAEPLGIDVIDVPTCRGGGAAQRGELLVLCGGSETDVDRAHPVLESFAADGDVVYLGPVGSGQVGKSANNTLLWASLVADYEVLTLAKSYGLDVDELREVLIRSSGDNWALHEWDWLHSKWAYKDMAITMNMAQAKGISMPLVGLLSQLVGNIDESDLDRLR